MDITTERIAPDTAVLALAGELDASNYRELVDAGTRLYGDGVRRLVLDLSELRYMSSSGIVAIHSVLVTFREGTPPGPDGEVATTSAMGREVTGGRVADEVRLVAPQPVVERGLKRTGFTDILRIYPDRVTALG